MSHDDETPRENRIGGLSLDDRLENIESDLGNLDKKIDRVLDGMATGQTRFSTIELTVATLTGRVTKMEEGRDAVVRLIVFAVIVAVLGLLGLKVAA